MKIKKVIRKMKIFLTQKKLNLQPAKENKDPIPTLMYITFSSTKINTPKILKLFLNQLKKIIIADL